MLDNQKLPYLVIISCIIVTLLFKSGVVLWEKERNLIGHDLLRQKRDCVMTAQFLNTISFSS